MTTQTTISVGVGPLTAEDVVAVARGGAVVALSAEAAEALDSGRRTIDTLAEDVRPHYGVSTL